MTTDDFIVEMAQLTFFVAGFALAMLGAEAGVRLWLWLKPRRNQFRRK